MGSEKQETLNTTLHWKGLLALLLGLSVSLLPQMDGGSSGLLHTSLEWCQHFRFSLTMRTNICSLSSVIHSTKFRLTMWAHILGCSQEVYCTGTNTPLWFNHQMTLESLWNRSSQNLAHTVSSSVGSVTNLQKPGTLSIQSWQWFPRELRVTWAFPE